MSLPLQKKFLGCSIDRGSRIHLLRRDRRPECHLRRLAHDPEELELQLRVGGRRRPRQGLPQPRPHPLPLRLPGHFRRLTERPSRKL